MGKALTRHVLGESNTCKRVKTYFSQELSNYQLHLGIILITCRDRGVPVTSSETDFLIINI